MLCYQFFHHVHHVSHHVSHHVIFHHLPLLAALESSRNFRLLKFHSVLNSVGDRVSFRQKTRALSRSLTLSRARWLALVDTCVKREGFEVEGRKRGEGRTMSDALFSAIRDIDRVAKKQRTCSAKTVQYLSQMVGVSLSLSLSLLCVV